MLMRPIPNRLSTFDALEGFLIWLKAALLVGAIVGSPGIFYHLWEFLASGLYPHERRYVYIYLPLSILLFVSGVCLAFFVIFELVIEFLLTYNEGMDIDFSPRLKDYISFALFLPLGFGIAFQLPMIMLALNRFGIVSVDMYVSKWRIAVLAIAFISMVLTPGRRLQHGRYVRATDDSVFLWHRTLQVHAERPRRRQRSLRSRLGFDPA